MTALQWALLLLGAGIIGVLLWSSRREKRALERWSGAAARGASRRDWAGAPGDEPPPPEQGFDEFGVGKPRRRTEPLAVPEVPAPAPRAPAAERPVRVPPIVRAEPAAPPKLVAFYIAEHEGTSILGPKIHAALRGQGLAYGARSIYHRLDRGQPVFSVASLVKPGHLDPAQAEGFSTPGLSVFLQLPGPANPVAAFHDLLRTARALAHELNAQLYDTERREELTDERARELLAEVEDWSRRHAAAR